MKIYNPNTVKVHENQQNGSARKGSKEIQGATSFLDILKASSNHATPDTSPTTAPVSGPLDIPSPVNSLTNIQEQALSKGQEVLSLLDHLSTMYNKIDVSESSLSSVADALDHNVAELKELRGRLDTSDPLRDTLEEIGILSVVERIKITRGDYT